MYKHEIFSEDSSRFLKLYHYKDKLKGSILVAHGLNQKPSSFKEIAYFLSSIGYEVFLLKLIGHEDNLGSINQITTETWSEQFYKAYLIQEKFSSGNNVPKYFLGYSLGALLGLHSLSTNYRDIIFNKLILLAPACATRKITSLIQTTFLFSDSFSLPSYTPTAYKSNSRLPIIAYKTLFKLKNELISNRFKKLNVPTLIFVDEKDEVISHKALKKQIKRFQLDQWILHTINRKRFELKFGYFHLIVDKESVGIRYWNKMIKEMANFLKNTDPR